MLRGWTKTVVVRPYGVRIRDRVFGLLQGLDFTISGDDIIPPATPDRGALEQIMATEEIGLLLLPYHQHRTDDGTVVSALTLAPQLDERFQRGTVPIFMPVSNFSWNSSAPRKIDQFREKFPVLGECIVEVPEAEIDGGHTRRRLQQAMDIAEAQARLPRSSL